MSGESEDDSEAPDPDDLLNRDELRAAGDSVPETDSDDATTGEDTDSTARSSPTPCPRCGTPVAMVTARGPGDTRVSPCGCRVRGNILDDE
ncbi:hypothetical protein [Halomontanus rarus]|uniref:hypothetical protein n=1 Tax=Halomontanus rarus TaxID=3034020 RepID=UPI0023E7D537|nr:hypothetical protein [Halovivax sp. TS33]